MCSSEVVSCCRSTWCRIFVVFDVKTPRCRLVISGCQDVVVQEGTKFPLRFWPYSYSCPMRESSMLQFLLHWTLSMFPWLVVKSCEAIQFGLLLPSECNSSLRKLKYNRGSTCSICMVSSCGTKVQWMISNKSKFLYWFLILL